MSSQVILSRKSTIRSPYRHVKARRSRIGRVLALACCRTGCAMVLGLVLYLPTAGGAEKGRATSLTVQRIFGSAEFQGESLDARWLTDQAAYTTLEGSRDGTGGRDLVRYSAAGGERTVLVSAADLTPASASTPLAIDNYAWSTDRSLLLVFTNAQRVWRQRTRGDYWILDRSSRQLRKLGGDAPPASLMFAKISPTGQDVAYVRERNIYVENLLDHSIRQLTSTDDKRVINGTFDWVYEEELSLRDGFRWSPDGASIAYWQIDSRGVPEFPLINNTDSLYPRVTLIPYPKVGQRNSACRVGVVDIRTARTQWIPVPGDPREHYIARMQWMDNSHELLLQQLNRLQNTNLLLMADLRAKGRTRTVLQERDEAWVDIHDELQWFTNQQKFTWISERDGWRHVYLAPRSGETLRCITPGPFDVIRLLAVDESGQGAYYLASPDNPTRQFLFRTDLTGEHTRRVTPADATGWHDYEISADARWAIHRYSSFDEPPVTELITLPEHRTVRVLVANTSLHHSVKRLRRQPVEFFRVDSGDDQVKMDGWCLKPPDFTATGQKYPLLVHVYGEPAGQTVLDRWGGANYLWHLMLAQRGCVVVSMDNRGTPAPRGREWRKCVYRKIGILGPEDQANGLKQLLANRPYLDPQRVAIWGWSGGGSSSLQAIFKYPELYQTAVAVAPVPNQRYYDTIYQERYMGLPSDNVEGFRQGSAVNYVDNLQGNLLLIHGTGDDNCHYQTVEILINELIRHNKPFTMMAYPNRTHAIREGRNTTLHLRELMTRYLTDKLGLAPETTPPRRGSKRAD